MGVVTPQKPHNLHCEVSSWPLDRQFQSDWDGLYTLTPCTSPFSRLEWLQVGIGIYADSKEILPLRFLDASGSLKAMGIFRMVTEPGKGLPRKLIRTIEYNSQRIVPFVAADGATMAEAMHALREAFPKQVDYYDFFKLDAMEGNLETIKTELTCRHLPFECTIFNEQPQFYIPATWEGYLEERTQGHRKKIRRYTRKLQEEYPDYQFTRLRTYEDFQAYGIDKVLEEVMGLFSGSWQAACLAEYGDSCNRLTTFYAHVAREFAPKGLLDICLLKADSHLLAFELNLCEAGSVYMLFGSYDRAYADWSPGNAIFSEIIQDGIRHGDKVLEFGGEHLDYKRLWTKNAVFSHRIRIFGRTPRAKVKRCIRFGKRILKKLLHR